MAANTYVGRVRRGQELAEQDRCRPARRRLKGADDDVLRVEHVTKRFGPSVALRDINLHLRKGEVLGLLGDNGAASRRS
jgi:ABC-type polysaccharide/polyol phosphate transport system ATPase subunit